MLNLLFRTAHQLVVLGNRLELNTVPPEVTHSDILDEHIKHDGALILLFKYLLDLLHLEVIDGALEDLQEVAACFLPGHLDCRLEWRVHADVERAEEALFTLLVLH